MPEDKLLEFAELLYFAYRDFIGDPDAILKDFGFASLSMFGIFMAIVTGVSLLFKELDKRTVLVVLAGWEVIKERPAQYMAAFLIMEGLMNGVFSALDAVLFYVFWEGMLIPMFLIIGVWGGPRRVYATIKFFLYTFLGSVFMLVALIYMYTQSGSFAILDFHTLKLGMTEQVLIFLAFLLAFAVKVPMWPVHTWLPDAHVEAPTGGSVILAAIMLKIGGYGFLRFSLPITPDASHALDWVIILMSLVAVVYIGFVALVQEDMKKLIAYSSIAHMGFVTLGIFLVFSLIDNAPGLLQPTLQWGRLQDLAAAGGGQQPVAADEHRHRDDDDRHGQAVVQQLPGPQRQHPDRGR